MGGVFQHMINYKAIGGNAHNDAPDVITFVVKDFGRGANNYGMAEIAAAFGNSDQLH